MELLYVNILIAIMLHSIELEIEIKKKYTTNLFMLTNT